MRPAVELEELLGHLLLADGPAHVPLGPPRLLTRHPGESRGEGRLTVRGVADSNI